MKAENNPIEQRLEALREVMRREHLAAFIFPSTDPHNSEYVPARWEGRKWISGFDGSAGVAVVTLHTAALWTDSRYFIAAEEQLRETEYTLMRERVQGTPTIAQWLTEQLKDSTITEIGIDGMCSSAVEVEGLIVEMRQVGVTVRTNWDPLEAIWTNRPPVPTNQIEIHNLQYAGVSCHEKLANIRTELYLKKADGMLVSALDDIAWTLNLRGSDVHCNPVFVAYLLIAPDRTTLFTDKRKLGEDVKQYLAAEGVETDDYNNVAEGLRTYFGCCLLVDSSQTNYTLYNIAQQQRYSVLPTASPIPAMKAVKNEAEIAGFRRAMVRDGVAMVRFLRWLRPAVERGGQTEMSVDRELTRLRAAQPLFCDLSFDTIAGYQAHGAIVHYEATSDTDAPLKPEGLLLLDSGAQYADGTTDITRTIALGPITDEQKRIYTLVLKGHLQLQNLCFPDGACGSQLDAVARMAMWREGMNFLHGTGHGVGSYLNVHEGPHQIRMEWRPAPLHSGMTVTDEPGLYLADRFGVRTENTLLVREYKRTEFGRFLCFEPLTLCPIDKSPILVDLLSSEERQWLNAYHQKVYDTLSPHLSLEEKAWLKETCSPL